MSDNEIEIRSVDTIPLDQGVKLRRIQRKPKEKTEEQMRQFMEKCLVGRKKKIEERQQQKYQRLHNEPGGPRVQPRQPFQQARTESVEVDALHDEVCPDNDSDEDVLNYLDNSSDDEVQQVRYTNNKNQKINKLIKRPADRTFEPKTLEVVQTQPGGPRVQPNQKYYSSSKLHFSNQPTTDDVRIFK